MNINLPQQHYWRNFFTRMAIIILTVALIVWFLPRNEGFRFRYDIGKPWMYNSFIAKFDFPIYKTDEALQEERDSCMRKYQPYYNYNAKVEKQQVNRFLNDFREGLPGLPAHFKNIVYNQLHRLYQTGIISTTDYGKLAKDTSNMIRVVNGKSAQSMKAAQLYSTLSAYEQLFTDEQMASQRQALQRCNLNEYLEPNLIYDKVRSEAELNDLLSGISTANGMVLAGQKVIDRGDIINEYDYLVLSSFEREMMRRSASKNEVVSTIAGQVIFVTILVLLFTIYLALFRREYFDKPRSITMLYAMITIFPILVSLMMVHNFFSVYILPFTMAPIFIRVFMDSRTAFITHAIMVLICAAAVRYQYEFIIIQLVAGLVAIYSLRELSKRSQLFKTALLVTLASCIVYLALQLMQDKDFNSIDRDMYVHFAVNGFLLLLTYPLMYLIEKLFGFTSDVSLFELSNTNRGLLRDLSEVAPGTFQHSITVGNLAAEIANKIGANSLLVRTGALYHDIGKMTNPVFFTENQAGYNPHDTMPSEQSASIVISHVTEGIRMAEHENLPSTIKNFILTHHGTGLTKYFYINYKNDHPNEEVDTQPYTYPGPNPFTREQAILMMADAVEAASRSLSNYTEEALRSLINRIIDEQVAAGFFKECPITFRDISLAKQVLTERLMAIYHTRISYPEMK